MDEKERIYKFDKGALRIPTVRVSMVRGLQSLKVALPIKMWHFDSQILVVLADGLKAPLLLHVGIIGAIVVNYN